MKEFIRKNEKNIGIIDYEKGTYTSPRNVKHVFNIFNGFGISLSLLEYLDTKKINKIILDFGGRKLETDIAFFWSKGESWNDKGDEQLILSREYWNIGKQQLQTTL